MHCLPHGLVSHPGGVVSPGPGGHPALAPVSLGPSWFYMLLPVWAVKGYLRGGTGWVRDPLGAHVTCCALSPTNVYPGAEAPRDTHDSSRHLPRPGSSVTRGQVPQAPSRAEGRAAGQCSVLRPVARESAWSSAGLMVPAPSDSGKQALCTTWVRRAPAPEVTQGAGQGWALQSSQQVQPRWWPAAVEGVMPPSASGETAGPTPTAQCSLALCPASPGPGGGTQPMLCTAGP